MGPEVNAYYGCGVGVPHPLEAPLTDPDSFGTALWTLLLITGIILAFGTAALSDMALRRREDREERDRRGAEGREHSESAP